MIFNPQPKEGTTVNPKLRKRMVQLIGHCEWLNGCPSGGVPLTAAHIRAKGMGGGRCQDTPENIIVLCLECHRFYDQSLGQSRQMQATLKAHIQKPSVRHPLMWEELNRLDGVE